VRWLYIYKSREQQESGHCLFQSFFPSGVDEGFIRGCHVLSLLMKLYNSIGYLFTDLVFSILKTIT